MTRRAAVRRRRPGRPDRGGALAVIDLSIERPVAGGFMLARHDGRVVLVAGAIPGERVRARVDRATRQVIHATTIEVLEPSPERREPAGQPACGGASYAHIAYAHQCALKAEVLADAFRHVGKLPLEGPVSVAPSPEIGYRLRARLHVRGRRVGFFREQTRELCDAAATGQLLPEGVAAAGTLAGQLGARADDCEAILLAENVAASQRVLHIEPQEGRRLADLAPLVTLPAGVTGVSARVGRRIEVLAGALRVADRSDELFAGGEDVASGAVWQRSAASFFQGNRYLTGRLTAGVLASVAGARVLDLYAGVGLFAVGLAARGATVSAVEAEPAALDDLHVNAAPWPSTLTVIESTVEHAVLTLGAGRFDTIVLDPPRSGASPAALGDIVRLAPPRLVYVSCDPATLARDAARLLSGGYRLSSLEAFDLFPDTAHVEALAVFDRQ
jgi:tRNA/tmRNA/rRNA uracil-C5-methylase (TrmA/RlmC/RlmD family)